MMHELSHEELKRQNIEQLNLAHSDDNKWFAGEKVGHDPTDDEMVLHYALYGSAKYRKEHE